MKPLKFHWEPYNVTVTVEAYPDCENFAELLVELNSEKFLQGHSVLSDGLMVNRCLILRNNKVFPQSDLVKNIKLSDASIGDVLVNQVHGSTCQLIIKYDESQDTRCAVKIGNICNKKDKEKIKILGQRIWNDLIRFKKVSFLEIRSE